MLKRMRNGVILVESVEKLWDDQAPAMCRSCLAVENSVGSVSLHNINHGASQFKTFPQHHWCNRVYKILVSTCNSRRLEASQELVFSAVTALLTSPAATCQINSSGSQNLTSSNISIDNNTKKELQSNSSHLFKESCKVFVGDQMVISSSSLVEVVGEVLVGM